MKDVNLQIEKITGSFSEVEACSVFTKRLSLFDGRIGTIVSLILLRNKDGGDFGSSIKDILELTTKKLESSTGNVVEEFENILEVSKNYVSEKKLEISLAYLFFLEGACYIARLGSDIKIEIFDPPKSTEIVFETGSGLASEGQIYLVATQKFFSLFDTSDLKQEAEIDFGEIIDGLATEISAEDDQSGIGAFFVHVKSTGEEEEAKSYVEEDQEGEVTKEDKEVDDYREPEEKVVDEAGKKTRIKFPSLRNPLPLVWREFSKLKHGDAAAISRLRRNLFLVAILIFLILAVSVGITVQNKKEQTKNNQEAVYLSDASSKYSEAVAILELNKSRARDLLVAADKQVKLALGIYADDEKAKQLQADISAKLKETDVNSNISFETLVDVSKPLVGLLANGKNLIASADGRIFEVNVNGKSAVEHKGVDGAKFGAFYDNKVFTKTNDKIIRVDLASDSQQPIANAAGGQDIAAFLGNIYLLFSDHIDKYVPVAGGYSGPTDYLNNKVDFGGGARFAIDGSVWVTSGSKVYKFTRGAKNDFAISGLVSAAGDFGLIYTNSNMGNIYVIDKTNSALLVIGKDGVYKKAYQSPEFGRVTGLVISDDEVDLYTSAGTKIIHAKLQ